MRLRVSVRLPRSGSSAHERTQVRFASTYPDHGRAEHRQLFLKLVWATLRNPGKKVAGSIANTTQVVRYDRAGLGCSPPASAPRTAAQISSELHEALSAAQIAPPYVLVSHSAGAWYAIVFAAQHPHEVKGLLLIDPTPPKFFSEVSSFQNEQERRELATLVAQYEAAASSGRRAEWTTRDTAARQAEAAVLQKQMPLVIITAAAPQPGRNAAILLYWRDQHERMSRATTRGRVVVAKAGHYVQLEQPQVVVRELQRLLAATGS